MTTIEISTNQVKVLAKALGYRKRKVSIHVTENVTLQDLNWSGGSRSEYHAVRLSDFAVADKPGMNFPAPWANKYEGAKVPLAPGLAIAETGYFCGRESVMRLYVHPADMPKLLPAGASGI